MQRRLRNSGGSLRPIRAFATGVLIGIASVTPAFAATAVAIDDLALPILLGSLVLLVVALALKLRRDQTARTAPPTSPEGFSEGIGRYRLQLGRRDAA